MTTLETTIVLPKLGYQYRRAVLPDAIYRTHYTPENRHLPTLVTLTDYEQLFLISVARNDVDATRALLNEGVPVNTTNAHGESALAVAQRHHAQDTERLLIARGAL